ncbi:MAG TPA: pantoate--beta-alanine ligase, partial [Candidatus Goldiibacteriota bacterium]|nr:pantoate--beta-alanine ligase [Candidatus Goldiibacteriota bacterium]
GQKDLQQAAVIKKMASDLNYGVSVVICPIIREKDGLAMSSRNIYLTPEQRNSAAGIYASLKMAESMIRLGEDDPETVIKEVKRKIRESGMEPDYAEIVDPETLEKKERITGAAAVAAAAYAGKTRLIDNIIVDTAR